MKNLELQLQRVQEDNIQEFIDPVTFGLGAAAIVGTARLIAQLTTFLLVTATLRRRVKVDKKLTKRVNAILKSGSTWIVHLYPEPGPNAFAIGGKHIFVTTGLLQLLDEREVEAVMLHEVFHNKDLHVWKQFAMTNSFFYLLTFIAMTATAAAGIFYLGLLIFYIINQVSGIAYNRISGRRHELKADDYAVKHGYGKDMAGALLKMEQWIKKAQSQFKCGKMCQLERSIGEALDEHPPLKKRVEIVLRKTKDLEAVMKSANFAKIKNFITKVFKENG